MENRCLTICGSERKRCFIRNSKQINCIADMILNKVSGILGIIELTLEENRNEKVAGNLQKATESIHELVNWVKFLQIAHDLRKISLQSEGAGSHDKRREIRYPFPDIYRKYLTMRVKIADAFREVVIINFSSHGVQFSLSEPLEVNAVIDCVLFMRHTIEKKVFFRARVRYSSGEHEGFVTGVEIEEMPEHLNFDFFDNMFEFIKTTMPDR